MKTAIDTSKLDTYIENLDKLQCSRCNKWAKTSDFKTAKQNHTQCSDCRSKVRKANLRSLPATTKPKPKTSNMKMFLKLLEADNLPLTLDLISRVTNMSETNAKKVLTFLESAGVVERKTHSINEYKIEVWSKSGSYKIFKEIIS